MTEEKSKWFDTQKDGLPQGAGTFICILRGATYFRLMRYAPDRDGWIGVGHGGGPSKSVTHWCKIPEAPSELLINILLRKANVEGLDEDEKLELSQLLRNSVSK